MFEQQKRHVVADVTAGVLVHSSHQGVQCLVAVGCEKRRFDRGFREEVPVLVTALD